jgi:hypothetical protein
MPLARRDRGFPPDDIIRKDHAMTLRTALLSGAAFAALASPAFALTADEVWQSQIGYLASLGFTVEATSTRDGSTTMMSDVRMVWPIPMGFGSVTITTPDVSMVENGDGTVAITYPDKFRMQIIADLNIDGERGTATVEIGVRLEDQSLTASGTPAAVAYASRTGLMDVVLDRLLLVENGTETIEPPPFNVIFNIRDLVTDTTIENDGQQYVITTDNTTGASIFEISYEEDGFESGWGVLSTTVGSVDSSFSNSQLVVPVTPVDWLNLSSALRNGLYLGATTEAIGSRQQTVTQGNSGEVYTDQTQSVEFSAQTLIISAEGFTVVGSADNVVFGMVDEFLVPFPIEITMENAYGGFGFPLLASADPQALFFDMALTNLTVPDALWSMADPGNILPRDPASFDLGLDATVINRVDVLDIMAWEGVVNQIDRGDIPVDIVSLVIDPLSASAIGATVTGQGSFEFDNSDRTTFPGFPRPDGQASAQMTGLYGVLDKLSQIGILPMEAGMGARAAIGMFAQATGEDQLSTTLSISDGTLTVNGMPIPLP